ncbi:hypothetical protein [Billgrantia ethanolica]|uniref:Phage abortive infection protein n=1 Tax=Billgrantia ethanolica TaxID=2733486 RepID=A0ABS9A191_9GAMM|nr:hypothetical protein [Halomonas ethanolica]MCE8002540.1 hypothetical protein [Halomonas ethanolica]
MREAMKGYWALVLGVVLVCGVAFGAYGIHFYGWPLSDDPKDWASFANYASGTAGVAILAATLLAFLVTLNQQNRLIEKQDKMIEQQERQLQEVEIHQRKVEAYSRAEKIFPTLLSSCISELGKSVVHDLTDDEVAAFKPIIISPNTLRRHFFNELMFPDALSSESKAFLSLVSSNCTDNPYKLAKFVAECLRDAPELKDYFYAEIGDYVTVIRSSIAYNLPLRKKNAEEVARLLSLPVSYHGLGVVESKWQQIGELLHGVYPARGEG